jgi:hypothetical protein
MNKEGVVHMTPKLIKEIRREEVQIANVIDEAVGVSLLHKSLMQQELILDIEYQFEFPVVFEKGGRYQAIANFLPLITQRFAPSDTISVIVIDYKASIIKKVACQYLLHLLSFQTTNELFYPLLKEVVLLNKSVGNNPHLCESRCSERGLAELLKVNRQTVRTYMNKAGIAK